MEWLKQGMKVKNKFGNIHIFLELINGEYWYENRTCNLEEEIDWEETAKLNRIYLIEELGIKENKGKIRPNLLPITELKEVIRVFEYGVEKHSINNWKHVKEPINEYSNALSRHLLDYLEGEKKASDSNLPHLAHICANALILMWFENNKEV